MFTFSVHAFMNVGGSVQYGRMNKSVIGDGQKCVQDREYNCFCVIDISQVVWEPCTAAGLV